MCYCDEILISMDSKTHFFLFFPLFFFLFKEGIYMTVEIVAKSHNLQGVLIGLYYLANTWIRSHFHKWLIHNESIHFNYC